MVIDLDLRNFLGSIEHTKLVAIVRMKIKDEMFIHYIARMLKYGVIYLKLSTKADRKVNP